MRAALFCYGSRGDSEPLAALALGLRAAGHEARLVTGCAEHRSLGFEARLWDEADPAPGERPPPSKGSEWLRRPLAAAAAIVPSTMGHVEAAGHLAKLPLRALLREILLSLPLVAWAFGVLLLHALSAPFAALVSGMGWRDLQGRPWRKWPSAVDPVMLIDAVARPQWETGSIYSRGLLQRCFTHLLAARPVPDALVDFVGRALDGADVVVVAEGADDPLRHALVCTLAQRRGIRLLRMSFFPRRQATAAAPSWLVSSSLPVLLPLLCRSAFARRCSHLAAAAARGVLRVVVRVIDGWHALLATRVFGVPGFTAWLSRCLGAEVSWADVKAALEPGEELHAWSRTLLPEGADGVLSLPSRRQRVQPGLEDWLEFSTDPVLYVSRVANAPGFQELLIALRPLLPGWRLLVNLHPWTSHLGLRDPDRVRFVEDVPHAWLFPRMTAALHHGGAGTTVSSLRYALPTLVVPTWGDQSLWGQRVHALGAGPEPIAIRWATPERLAAAVEQLPAYASGAKAVAEALAEEDGLQCALARVLQGRASTKSE